MYTTNSKNIVSHTLPVRPQSRFQIIVGMYSMTALLKNSTLHQPNLKREAALPAFALDEQRIFPPAFPYASEKIPEPGQHQKLFFRAAPDDYV
jgi:hypothetical protein